VGLTSSSVTVSTVSGGGVSSWTRLKSYSSGGEDDELWLGTVSSPGASTISITYSGSVSSTWVELSAQEFSSGLGTSTTWALDNAGVVSGSSTSLSFPSLTPAGSKELYFGYCDLANTASAGSTTGFTYVGTAAGDLVAYNPNVSSTVAPTASQSPSGGYASVAALVTASVFA
jgi:hypothetical protein